MDVCLVMSIGAEYVSQSVSDTVCSLVIGATANTSLIRDGAGLITHRMTAVLRQRMSMGVMVNNEAFVVFSVISSYPFTAG